MRLLIAMLAAALPTGAALAQNAPLSALPVRGTVQSTDIIPIEPAAGPQLMQTTVTALAAAIDAGGTVAGITVPGFTCAGSPTIACTVAAPANQVYAGPCGGPAAAPAFRAICTADLPMVGTAGNYVLPISITTDAYGRVTNIVGGACTSSCGMPALGAFTWVNQGGATASQPITAGPIGLSIPDSGSSVEWRGLFVAVPTCPWKLTATVRASLPNTNSSSANGIYLYDGTKLVGWETLYTSNGYMSRIEHINSVSVDGSTPFSGNQGFVMRNDIQSPLATQIRDDCTSYYFDSSVDGVVFFNEYSEAVGSYIAATNIGVGGVQVQGATSPLYVSLFAWQLYGDANLNGP